MLRLVENASYYLAEAAGEANKTGITGQEVTTGTVSGNSAVTLYGYENGRLKQVTDPEKGVSSYGYDSRGNIKCATDPMGNMTEYSYDWKNYQSQG